MRHLPSRLLLMFAAAFLTAGAAGAQVTNERLLNARNEPQNWLQYGGTYDNQRYSTLDQINQDNVKNLELKWIHQTPIAGNWETVPLVVDGIMYITQRSNDVLALDAKTGKAFWLFRWTPDPGNRACCGSNNRGLAILGNTLYMGTLDAHLLAIDAKSGKLLWNTTVADTKIGYSITMAPVLIKDKVMVGVAGGEYGIRGFVSAYDVKTGKEVWKTYTIPGPGEPGNETWEGDSWKTGGSPVWNAGSYDPALNLVYFGTGNPGPDYNPAQRKGDNLYADCVLALDVDTGKLKWYYQFTPGDPYDLDATQVPILADMDWNGKPAKVMLFGNRNGYFYVLDRATGKFLLGQPYVPKVNWTSGMDKNGRPIMTPPGPGKPNYPGAHGATNYYAPAYSPHTGLFYISAWENYGLIGHPVEVKYVPGRNFTGGGNEQVGPVPGIPQTGNTRPGPINSWTNEIGNGATVAIDPHTGKRAWSFTQYDFTDAGIMTTVTDLVFTGGREGYFYVLDAKTGKLLWKASLGGTLSSGPVTYMVDGKQYVTLVAGNVLTTFGLRD